MVSYPLAPKSPAKDSIPSLVPFYRSILQFQEGGEQVILMGDSAGGNVALCLVLYVLSQDPEAPIPNSIFLISPCADARNSNPQMKLIDKHESILSVSFTGQVAEKWAVGLDRADPLVTPLLGPLELLKERGIRVDGITGTYDVLSPDTLLLIEKLQKVDVTGSWLVWERQMHCFPLAWRYGLSDSKQGADWIIEQIKSL